MQNKFLTFFTFFLLLFLLSLSSITVFAFSLNCTTTRILDGDTFHCLPATAISNAKTHKDGTITIRMRGIDAPEKRQPYGIESQKSLKELIGRKTVKLEIKNIDRYGRVVAYVFIGNININLEQVKRGYAWAYAEYLDRPYASEFYDAEKQARKQKLGLWQQLNPTSPWEWRKKNR